MRLIISYHMNNNITSSIHFHHYTQVTFSANDLCVNYGTNMAIIIHAREPRKDLEKYKFSKMFKTTCKYY